MEATKTRRILIVGGLLMVILITGVNGQELKDIDSNVYRTVKYGVQTWMAGNLNVSHFRNGEVIPEAKTETEWAYAASTPSI